MIWGIAIADLAVESGVAHLVYSSGAAVGDKPTGLGHFDSKARIEAHIRTLPITATIIRPAAFMDMLTMPGFGLDEGRFNCFARREQSMQLLAVEDIGKLIAPIFADPVCFGGKTFQIAGNSVTGQDLEELFTQASGRPIGRGRQIASSNASFAPTSVTLPRRKGGEPTTGLTPQLGTLNGTFDGAANA